jgi:hypothetical protein
MKLFFNDLQLVASQLATLCFFSNSWKLAQKQKNVNGTSGTEFSLRTSHPALNHALSNKKLGILQPLLAIG